MSGELADNEIELRMRASAARPSALQALTADLAMRADFDLDSVADLRLAVDEVCATVVDHASPDAMLTCRFALRSELLEIVASAECTPQPLPRTRMLSWQMLESLADSARLWTTDGDGHEQPRVHVRIVKLRDSAAANGQ